MALVALIAGVLAWFKVLAASVRIVGIWRRPGEIVWSLMGVALIAAFMIGVTLALREAREVDPTAGRAAGTVVPLVAHCRPARGLARRPPGCLIPVRFRGTRHPVLVWSVTLPVWLALCLGSSARAPPRFSLSRCSWWITLWPSR